LIYWVSVVIYFGLTIAVSQHIDHPEWTRGEHIQHWLSQVWPWIPSALLILPLVVFDMIRLSHSFVGPIVRIRYQLAKLLANPNCTPVVLRVDDYWQDLSVQINDLQNNLLSLHVALKKQREMYEADRLAQSNAEASKNLESEVQVSAGRYQSEPELDSGTVPAENPEANAAASLAAV
jgi:hypothetical protein